MSSAPEKPDPRFEGIPVGLAKTLAELELRMKANPKPQAPEPAKPDNTAKVIQFPLFPEERRPVSNDVARSALFSCVQGKDRAMVKDTFIASIDGVEIRFTGEQFNQDDHDLLMQVLHMAAHKPLGEWVMIPGHAILKGLGRATGGKDHKQLRADFTRLRAGTMSIRNTRTRAEYIGGLLHEAAQDEGSRFWAIRLNPNLRALYGSAQHTLIDWEQRKALRGKDLARWLQLYLATHAKPFPIKVVTLRDLSGSKTALLKNFRVMLRKALQDLAENGDVATWTIDPATDLVTIDRGAGITDSQHKHLTKRKTRRDYIRKITKG